ncbi:MAG: hypothetical protein AABX71_01825, partial [Nanoarchaeota archaeon]
LKELTGLFTTGVKYIEPNEISGSLRGRNNIYNHLDMMIRGAEKSITIATTAEGLNRKLEALMPSLEKAKKKGIKIRIAAPITPNNMKVAREMGRVAEVKSMDNFRGRFAIIDEKEIMFMLLDDEKVHPTYDVGVWLNTEFFAKVLGQMFDPLWQGTKTAIRSK